MYPPPPPTYPSTHFLCNPPLAITYARSPSSVPVVAVYITDGGPVKKKPILVSRPRCVGASRRPLEVSTSALAREPPPHARFAPVASREGGG